MVVAMFTENLEVTVNRGSRIIRVVGHVFLNIAGNGSFAYLVLNR